MVPQCSGFSSVSPVVLWDFTWAHSLRPLYFLQLPVPLSREYPTFSELIKHLLCLRINQWMGSRCLLNRRITRLHSIFLNRIDGHTRYGQSHPKAAHNLRTRAFLNLEAEMQKSLGVMGCNSNAGLAQSQITLGPALLLREV